MPIVNCAACGTSLERPQKQIDENKHQFCNQHCYGIWRSKQMTGLNNPTSKLQVIPCFGCGKELLRAPWQLKRHKRMFCTPECWQAWLDKEKQAQTIPCIVCGKETRYEGTKVRRNKTFFCSTECRDKWRSEHIRGEKHPNWIGPVVLVCVHCEKIFERTRVQAHEHIIGKRKKAFCSEECMFDYMTKQCGEDHPWYKRGGRYPYYGRHWRTNRNLARERDDYTCQDCGITEEQLGKQLDVHHKIPRADGGSNELDNLISLCPSCHTKREHVDVRSSGVTLRKSRHRSFRQ